jgi:hypothetical protein
VLNAKRVISDMSSLSLHGSLSGKAKSCLLPARRCHCEWAALILSVVDKASMIQCNYWIRMLHWKRIADVRS